MTASCWWPIWAPIIWPRSIPDTGRVLRHIVTGKGAHNLFLSPDGRQIWVDNRVAGTTEVLDAATLKPLRLYRIPGGPDDLAFAANGKVWITRRWAEKVAVLDPATGTYATIDVGRSPHGIWLDERAPATLKLALWDRPADPRWPIRSI